MNFDKTTREQVSVAQGGYCKLCEKAIRDFHHKLHNTTANRKLFPLYIQSVFNCVGLCRQCHTDSSWKFNITELEAAMYEQALQELKDGKENKRELPDQSEHMQELW